MDGSAYMEKSDFLELLAEVRLDEVSARDTRSFFPKDTLVNELYRIKLLSNRYNAIFHLVTAADGAEAFYSLENNKTRYASPFP